MRRVLITGGSGGIGEACVRAFRVRGDEVYFTYLKNEKHALDISRETGAHAISCDLRSAEQIKALLSSCGGADILINNAGVSHVGLITDMTDAEYRELTAVNLDAVFFACREALPYMIRKKSGCIINISSMWGRSGASCEAAYSASKAAVIGLSQALAREAGPSGVRVNCIAPGVIRTAMNAHLTDEDKRQLADETPLGRIGEPEDVAQAALYLADAGFVTGQTLGVDGGFII